MKARLPHLLLVVLCLSAPLACKEEAQEGPGQAFYPASYDPFAQTLAQRDSVFTVLAGINQKPFREAFARLTEHTFTRYTRTEQFDREDYLVAFREQVVRHEHHGARRSYVTLSVDSAGAFDYGYFSAFVSGRVRAQDPPDLIAHVAPEDPPYLSPRNRDAYVYRLLPDTLMWDVVARVVEIRARPEAGDGQNIRRVRLYVDRGTETLIAMSLERIDLAMLFREESRFYLHIRPSGGEWVPYNTRFESRISVPFRPPQLFRTVSTYYHYGAAG